MIAIIITSLLLVIGLTIFLLWRRSISIPKLIDQDKTIDLQILEAWIDKLYKLEKLNGTCYLGSLNNTNHGLNFIHGYADLDCRIDIDKNSTFRLASLSKSFTAFATIKMSEEYQIPLESDFGEITNEPLLKGISILDLIQHRSGLVNDYLKITANSMTVIKNDQIISAYMAKILTNGINVKKPFKYLNINYVLLTRLFPLIANLTFEEYLHQLLNKYGLSQTTTINNLKANTNMVSSYESFFNSKHLPIRGSRFDQIIGDGGGYFKCNRFKNLGADLD